jgi:hypothetical protein
MASGLWDVVELVGVYMKRSFAATNERRTDNYPQTCGEFVESISQITQIIQILG